MNQTTGNKDRRLFLRGLFGVNGSDGRVLASTRSLLSPKLLLVLLEGLIGVEI